MRRIALAEIGGRGAFVADPRYRPGNPGAVEREPVADAYDKGFADGERLARERALADLAASEAARSAIELSFARFDEASAALLRERLRACVLAICQDMAGPVALDHAGLVARVEAAASLMRRKHDERVVRLHPDDLALVEPHIDPGLTLIGDPAVPRGALRIDGEHGGVEDGAEQWRTALQEALGECSL